MEQLRGVLFYPELLLLLDPGVVLLKPDLIFDGHEPEQDLEVDDNLVIAILLYYSLIYLPIIPLYCFTLIPIHFQVASLKKSHCVKPC